MPTTEATRSRGDVLLRVEHLTTGFDVATGMVRAVDDVSFTVHRGETLGLVGESGCGKSLTAWSIMRLVQLPGRIVSGRVTFDGRDLLAIPEREMQAVRGARISLIFQEPMSALNPVFTVGDQIAEAVFVHRQASRRGARARAVELLEAVRIPDPARSARAYPHQLSGGMRQRVLIAMALACRPALVIADEPTTALDVTIQAEILDLLREMKAACQLSLLLITHDLGVVAEMADRVLVMYAGRIVEEAPVRALFAAPAHPYTQGLLASVSRRAEGRHLPAIEGSVPDLSALPPGCAFGPRCALRIPRCSLEAPGESLPDPDRMVRCHLYPGQSTGPMADLRRPAVTPQSSGSPTSDLGPRASDLGPRGSTSSPRPEPVEGRTSDVTRENP
jgi:peptide/nickel transport system ATP-binding protein